MKLTLFYVYEERKETEELLHNQKIPQEDMQIIRIQNHLAET